MMLKKLSFGTASVLVALVLALSSALTAFAITIVVDGNQETAWTSGSGGQTPGVTTDPDEAGIANNSDILTFRWTNDTSNMYFLIETWASPVNTFHTWTLICLDIDNNPSTGSTSSSPYYDQCNSQTGFEYFVYVTSLGGELDDVNANPIPSATVQSVMGTVEEISVALSDLGFGPGNCPSAIRTVVYFDGGNTNPDDNTPDSGTFSVNCGSPTAITLNDLHATSSAPYLPLAMGGASFVLVAGAGFALRKRYMP